MDVVLHFKKLSYLDHFDYVPCWFNLTTESGKLDHFLGTLQKHNDKTYRLYSSDLKPLLQRCSELETEQSGPTRCVIQKANLSVKRQTGENGYTTRLLFLIREGYRNAPWMVYGFGKGRFNSLSKLAISEKCSLGVSLFQNDFGIESTTQYAIPDTEWNDAFYRFAIAR